MPSAFIAMPFAQKFYPVYQTIKTACEQLGIKTIRIDEVWAREDIYKQIEEEILKSDFVVADFTGDKMMEVANPNVVHEAAFARINKKYIILMAQDHKCLPFDWRTRPATIYKQTDTGLAYLKERLYLAIQSLMQKQDFGQENSPESIAATIPSGGFAYGNMIPPLQQGMLPQNSMMPQQNYFVPSYAEVLPTAQASAHSSPNNFMDNLLGLRQQELPQLELPLPPGFQAHENFVLCSRDSSLMAWIPGTKFMMGGDEDDDQQPIHELELSSYLIDIHPVTNEQFSLFMEAEGYQQQEFWSQAGWQWRHAENITHPAYFDDPNLSGPKQPVVGVSWYEAEAYATWAGKHLPTEAQWEYAARGEKQTIYPWGDVPPSSSMATYKSDKTSETMSKPEGHSHCGCHDMAGNVWEWCKDWYDEDYYATSPRINPIGPDQTSEKVCRGGSWTYDADVLKTYYRFFGEPTLRDRGYGFRCARIL